MKFAKIRFALALGLAVFGQQALVPMAQAEFDVVEGSFFGKTHEESTYPVGEPNIDVAALKDDTLTPPVSQAGAHPEGTTSFSLTERLGATGNWLPTENVRDVEIDLPAGFNGDPLAAPACDRNLFLQVGANPAGGCQAVSQVGIASLQYTQSGPRAGQHIPVYNIVPTPGAPATLGMRVLGQVPVFIDISLRDNGDYGLTAVAKDIASAWPLFGSTVTIWGAPADPRYDNARWNPAVTVLGATGWGMSLPDAARRAFITNAMNCAGGPLETTIRVRSWQHPAAWSERDISPSPQPDGCEQLGFDGDLELQPARAKAEVPTGVEVRLEFPYGRSADSLAKPPLKRAVVTLPRGVTISPGAAKGLAACSEEQSRIGRPGAAACPEAAKLGTVDVKTPMFEKRFKGAIYQATPYDNPFESLIALYLTIDDEERGIHIKLAGRVDVDPATGQLTSTFDDNPQYPFTDMTIRFFGGDHAALVTPETCGTYETVTELTPWSAPGSGPPVVSRSSFSVEQDVEGRNCAGAERPLKRFEPWLDAGASSVAAASHASLITRFGRDDRDDEISSLEVDMPAGLLAKLRGVELCERAAADAGDCPAASKIGRVSAASGPGSAPIWVPEPGKSQTAVYLSGSYEAAPYSLSVVVPAQAGPFDLGRVVVRAPIEVDERTAELSVGIARSFVYGRDGTLKETIEGAMPRMLEGIPLRLKEVQVLVDRDEFILNPSNCEPHQVAASLFSFSGTRADLASRFQVANCATLGFAPRFRAKILDRGRRSTRRSWHPRTRFAVRPRPGDANIGGARVALPSSTILDQANIGTTCTRARMAARNCPARSLVGYAKAWSPLLNRAIEGPVYLAANGGVRPLPDITAVLDGEVRILLTGEISTLRTGRKARLQNTFRLVPDAPVKRFELTMRGGKNRGLLVNSTDLCRSRERGVAVFTGQNGRRHRLRPRIGLTFKGCQKVRRKAAPSPR